jgi:hypothetical protein
MASCCLNASSRTVRRSKLWGHAYGPLCSMLDAKGQRRAHCKKVRVSLRSPGCFIRPARRPSLCCHHAPVGARTRAPHVRRRTALAARSLTPFGRPLTPPSAPALRATVRRGAANQKLSPRHPLTCTQHQHQKQVRLRSHKALPARRPAILCPPCSASRVRFAARYSRAPLTRPRAGQGRSTMAGMFGVWQNQSDEAHPAIVARSVHLSRYTQGHCFGNSASILPLVGAGARSCHRHGSALAAPSPTARRKNLRSWDKSEFLSHRCPTH